MTATKVTPTASDPAACLQAWRDAGADCIDPLRFHYLEALMRRAETLHDPARAILRERLATGLEHYAARVAVSHAAAATGQDGPFQGLKADFSQHAPTSTLACARRAVYPDAPELHQLRTLWSRLSADLQLQQSQDQLPDNAGPLNSSHVAHRALSRMRDLSPAYFHQFLPYIDSLSWLEQWTASVATSTKESARASTARRARTTQAKTK